MAVHTASGLSLCAGIGGIDLGIKLALGDSYRTVAYVEREAYVAACLVARMRQGYLDEAPIWDNLQTFDGLPWRGVVDLITAGFPCQPFSLAGKRLKEKDPRHLWPEIARVIRECEPGLVFLENNNTRAFKEPWRDLQAMGFTVSDPYAITAAEMGAGHLRRRVFVLAYRNGEGLPQQQRGSSGKGREGAAFTGAPVSNEVSGYARINFWRETEKGWSQRFKDRKSTWWASEPRLERLVHGVPNRVDRDRALGNAVVPAVAAKAFRELMDRAWKQTRRSTRPR